MSANSIPPEFMLKYKLHLPSAGIKFQNLAEWKKIDYVSLLTGYFLFPFEN